MAVEHVFPINIWADQKAVRMAYTAGGLIEYIGYALPRHQLRDKECWGIVKCTYDGNNRQITKYYADAENLMNKTWSLRATYTYA